MNASAWPFPLLPMEVVDGADALEIAQRAYDEHDERWIPITADFADELQADGDVARYELGVAALPRTHKWEENSECLCVLPADKKTWRGHGLLRIMTLAQFTEWCEEWVGRGRGG